MKKVFSIILSAVLCFMSVTLFGCDENFVESKIETENYVQLNNVKYGTYNRNVLNLFIPKNVNGEVGLILFIHGGAWRAGDKEGYTQTAIEWCEKGFVTCAINYRYINDEINGFDELNDITNALQKVKEEVQNFNIETKKVLLTGGSAGAHLSLLYAYARGKVAPITPVAVCSFSGPTNLNDENYYKNEDEIENFCKLFSFLSGSKFNKTNYNNFEYAMKAVSPIEYAESAVPTIICQGKLDSVVPYTNGTILSEKLTECGVEHSLIIFENSNHGLEADADKMLQANELMLEYANKYLK